MRRYNEAMRSLHARAGAEVLAARNPALAGAGRLTLPVPGREGARSVDVHGLHVDEASGVVERAVAEARRDGARHLMVLTGTGHHSRDRRARLLPGVSAFLDENGARAWEYAYVQCVRAGAGGGDGRD